VHYSALRMPEIPLDPLLAAVGARVRRLRLERDWTQRELAARSGLSQRFIAQLEGGRGNIALTRLATLARVLEAPLESFVAGLAQESTPCGVIALLGLRGAGKSTLGRELARRLGVAFVEHDELIEEAAGMERAEIFSIHGEDYYGVLARRTLDRLLAEARPDLVLATTGGLVADAEAFETLQRRATTVWLKATTEDHWQRVLDQGDFRPMQDRPDAFAELERLVERRAPLYARAHHCLDTSALGTEPTLLALERIGRGTE